MTTLILDRQNKVLYADQKETYSKGKLTMKCKKILPVYLANRKHWGWIALAGDSAEGYTFLHYLSKLPSIDKLHEPDDKRNNWKELGGYLVGKDGSEYGISNEGVPLLIEERLVADGAGFIPAQVLLDYGCPIPQVFALLAKRTGHTSKEFDYIEYGKKNAKVVYDQTYQG